MIESAWNELQKTNKKLCEVILALKNTEADFRDGDLDDPAECIKGLHEAAMQFCKLKMIAERRLAELTKPRPMSEAPKDGTRILAYNHADEEWQVIAWKSDEDDQEAFFWYLGYDFLVSVEENQFAHWFPLPEPPNAKENVE